MCRGSKAKVNGGSCSGVGGGTRGTRLINVVCKLDQLDSESQEISGSSVNDTATREWNQRIVASVVVARPNSAKCQSSYDGRTPDGAAGHGVDGQGLVGDIAGHHACRGLLRIIGAQLHRLNYYAGP